MLGCQILPTCTQVYLILDEFVMSGEIQETSKRVILDRLKELDSIDT
jgi:AP-2 complex subunit sigma-1